MERVVELLRLLLVQRVRPAVLELVERERDRAAARERVDQERARRPERGGRQRQNAAEDHGVDRHRGRREAPAASICASSPPVEAHYRWFLVQGIDGLGGVVGDLLQRLLGEHVRVRAGLSTVSGSSVGKRMPAALGRELAALKFGQGRSRPTSDG